MNVRLRLLGAFLTLFGGTVAAQDVQDVLQAVSANMGADNLNCVTYTATGYVGLVGQTFDIRACLLYTSPSPRDLSTSRLPSSA